jgi:fatty acid desaturase
MSRFGVKLDPMDDVAPSWTSPRVEATRSEIRRRFADAFRIRPWIYWLDLVASAALGWGLFAVSVAAAPGSALHLLATAGAIFALLRAALFIHELAHLRSGDLPGFEAVWNLLVGIPVAVPSLMYVGSHADHHKRTGFGTEADPEYAPIARWSRLRIAVFVATVAFVPMLLVLRWGVLGPLSRLFPRLRRVVVARCSTLIINVDYLRPEPRGRAAARWAWGEAGAAAGTWLVAAGVLAGWIAPAVVVQWLVVAAGILVVNQVRTLAAHGYENAGEPVDSEGQLLDSINLTGWAPLNALLAPVGLRYHALHHFLPSLPYHSLGYVHRRLLVELPSDAPYRRTLREGFLAPLQKLWHKAEPGPA